MLLIGIAASSSFQTNREVSLRPGDSAEVSDYRVTYREPTVDVNNERIAFGALLEVREGEGEGARPCWRRLATTSGRSGRPWGP